MSLKCFRCKTSVYANEEVKAEGVSWHETCFKCILCKKGLQLGAQKSGNHNGVKEVYCASCYQSAHGPKGFIGGGAGGVLGADFKVADSERVVAGSGSHIGGQGMAKSILIGGGGESAPASKPAGGAKFCSSCGTKGDGGRFCSSCGGAL